jgi:putative peptide zinc metalloprotease protein
LRFTLALVAQLAGDAFAKRALQAAYDALPWAERETADHYIFPTAPWASELSQRFHSRRDARLRLLRSLDFFLPLDDNDLRAINTALVEQPLAAGEVLLRRGTRPPGIWIVDVGEVAGWRGGVLVAELHQGDVVAPWALADEQPSKLTYRASVASTLLFLPHAALHPLLRAQLRSESRASAAVLSQLERVPLFAELPRHQLRVLAQQARRETFGPRALIVRQGQPGGRLYVIQRGQAAVVASSEGKGRVVARLGPGELFGELAFLRRQPPVASVVALSDLDVLAFEYSALEQLLVHKGVAQSLERIGTGRLLSLHQR